MLHFIPLLIGDHIKVSLTAFGQNLPKILPVVHISSFIIMTYLRKSSLELNPLLQNSV